MAQQPLVSQGLLIIEALRSHSVGLLWTSDKPDTETSGWQHAAQVTDIDAPGGNQTHNPSKRAVAAPRRKTARPPESTYVT
jgi:hypothetical protein